MMEVVVITSPDKFQSEIPDVISMFMSGLKTLHVRKSKFDTKKLSEYIECIPEQFHNRLVIHTHHKLALKYNLKGIHISKKHRKKSIQLYLKLFYFRFRKKNLVFTRSFHQLESLTGSRIRYNYVFLNPFFSKIDPTKNSFDVNPNYLNEVISGLNFPVYASGNIRDENYKLLKNTTVKGVVLSRMLWNHSGDKGEFIEKIKKEMK